MTNTVVEDLLEGYEGTIVNRGVDLLMGHDGTASLVIDRFHYERAEVWDASKVMLVFDHFSLPATVERANIQRKLLIFAKQESLPFQLNKGICHQLLLEDPRVSPGALVIGADSHTTTAGATGALATGVGATDFFEVLRSGKIWLKVPETIRVNFTGCMPRYIQGTDIALEILRILGPDGANYRCLEFHDNTTTGISMDSRATICNMAVDIGAKFGFFIPDAITKRFIDDRGGPFRDLRPSLNAKYSVELDINVSILSPLVSRSAIDVIPIEEALGTKVNQVFFGSCTAGRLEDFRIISKILQNKKIDAEVKAIAIPASNEILRAALVEGYIESIVNAGVILSNSSCGPCCNIDKGVLGDDEVCVSTSNRNYPGRMGSLKSKTLLTSTVTAVVASIFGEIADPREFMP